MCHRLTLRVARQSTSVAIRKARAARQKQVLERRKRAKDNETSPSQRRKGDEAAPEEPDVVIPSMPKLEPPDMANFALTALANPWPMTEAAAQEKRKVEALGRIALVSARAASSPRSEPFHLVTPIRRAWTFQFSDTLGRAAVRCTR